MTHRLIIDYQTNFSENKFTSPLSLIYSREIEKYENFHIRKAYNIWKFSLSTVSLDHHVMNNIFDWVRRKFITYKCLSIHPFFVLFLPRRELLFKFPSTFPRMMWCAPSHYCRLISNGYVYISNEYENEVNERRILKILGGVVKVKFTDTFTHAMPAEISYKQALTTLMYSWE